MLKDFQNLLIPLATGIGGWLIATLNNRHKRWEISTEKAAKARQNSLDGANQYKVSVFIPMFLAITKLGESYDLFQTDSNVAILESKIDLFLNEMETIRTAAGPVSGIGLSLVPEIPLERLTSFMSFLRGAKNAQLVVKKIKFGYRIGLLDGTLAPKIEGKDKSYRFKIVSLSEKYSWIIGFHFKGIKIISAPIISEAFEQRFIQEIEEFSFHLKSAILNPEFQKS